MTKTFKLVGLCLLTLSLTLSVASCCGNDDDDNNNGTNPGGTPATHAMSTSGRNIKTLTLSESGDNVVANFTYDAQGRVTQENIDVDGEHMVTTYEYNDGTIVATRSANNAPYGTIVYTLTDGLVSNSVETDAEDPNNTYSYRYQYQDKCLTAFGDSDYMTSCSWTNGNLTGMDDGEVAIAYSTEATATSKIELWLLAEFDDLSLALQGYFGNGTKNRLAAITNNFVGATFNVAYEVDNHGDPTHITISLSYGGETSVQEIDIVWE